MAILTETKNQINFSPHGYPLDPSGRMYTRAEIVSDPSIPLPLFVDPINPPAYWQRRSGAEMAAEAKRIADKNRRNKQARERRQAQRNGSRMVTMATIIAAPTLALVERVNTPTQPEPLTAADWDDGPQSFAESIQELLGQDYKAERARLANPARVTLPTAAESQRMLDLALNPGKANIAAPQRWQFGRGR